MISYGVEEPGVLLVLWLERMVASLLLVENRNQEEEEDRRNTGTGDLKERIKGHFPFLTSYYFVRRGK